MENTTAHTDQDSNIPQYVIGIKAYRRAIRREHNARSKNACPWCENTNTVPFEEEGYSQEAPQQICTNCFYIFSAPADSPQGTNRHQG